MSSAPAPRSKARSKPSSLRNAPLSLRTPSGRNPTSTHISLVFADTLVSGSDGALTSEETLLRQLDGDLGGRQIGLRSRRGSSATLRTVRTRGGSIASMALLEEGENGQAIAGPSKSAPLDTSALPSTLSPTAAALPDAGIDDAPHMDRSRRTVNPKNSSSWLRWNSPAPSFPRSKSPSLSDKGKGKGRADGMATREARSGPGQLTSTGSPSAGSLEPLPEPTTPPSAEPSNAPPTASLKPPDISNDGVSASPKRRSWFGWNASQGAAVPTEDTPKAVKTTKTTVVDDKETAETVAPVVEPLQADSIAAPRRVDSGSNVDAHPPTAGTESKGPSDEPKPPVSGSLKHVEDTAASAGWGSYFWGTGKTVQATATAKPEPKGDRDQQPGDDVEGDTTDNVYPTESAEAAPPTGIDAATEGESSGPPVGKPGPVPQTQEAPGWGSFFYPFVTPKPPAVVSAIATEEAEIVEPASGPAADQRPIPAPSPEPPKVNGDAHLAPPPSQPMTRTDNDPDTLTPKSTPRDRQNSTASASGWLNYLAFRASQKKITNPSTTSIKSGKEKKRISMEVGEEVMDFSTDPNFPMADDAPKKDQTAKSKEKPVDPKAQTFSTSKSSQPLSVRQRKLSSTSSRSGTRSPVPASPKAPGKTPAPAKTPNSKTPLPPAPALPNLVIPSFESTFSRPPRSLPPSFTQSGITGTTWRAIGAVGNYVYGDKQSHSDARGHKASRGVGDDLPRRLQPDDGWRSVKRIAIVGVHGWFPARMLNSVIGEPTGTSVKFASMMEQAVRDFFKDRGMDHTELRITPMPLEGEGTIEHRVDRLYNAYLANAGWVNDLRRADAVFFAAHSQGCIVTIHLISRMIAQGHIRTPFNRDAAVRCEWAFGPVDIIPDTSRKRVPAADQKVAMLSMCGVHLGPLYSISTSSVIQPYLQWFENAAARELFEFQESSSAVSVAYQKALSMVLENGVKVLLLASLNDQVVPIYGASFSTATHPLLLRALFVDGASYAQSDFMTHLLSFAFMLRNAGINDQRLVEHLSEATAGSLTGLGHSSPYEEIGCYSLAVEYLFLSGPANSPSARPTVRSPAIPLVSEPFSAKEARNDYELPYLMRAIVDSPEINDLFPDELKALKDGIIAWKPVTKALKEVKRRLEPMANRPSPLSSSVTASQQANTASTLKRDW